MFKFSIAQCATRLVVPVLAAVVTACGGGGGGGAAPAAPTPPAPAGPTLARFAGNLGGVGNIDGTGAAAGFFLPTGVATDSAGNVYVADHQNDTIRRITADGVVTTIAGKAGVPGSADGTGAAARFDSPYGVAVDGAGNVYVADAANNTVRKISPAGVVSTLAGTAGTMGSADGTGAAARFLFPYALATDAAGNVYVTDFHNDTVRKITPQGAVTTLAGTAGSAGATDGTGAAASFNGPSGVALDAAGNLYVADYYSNIIRQITPAGAVSTLAGTAGITGAADGTGASASFYHPAGVAMDRSGNLYVADAFNCTIRRVTATGVVTTFAGAAGTAGSTDAAGAAARFRYPAAVATDSGGNVFVADMQNDVIRKITPSTAVTTLAGTAALAGSADGSAADAQFAQPQGIVADGVGNLYVADTANNVIRRISAAGEVSTIAGTAGSAGSTDGTGSAARFSRPTGVAVDGAGNLYVADFDNNTIRRITASGEVSTLAGSPTTIGSLDGTGAGASFSGPISIAIDGSGNLYVADCYNQTIRKVTPTGTVTTVAGMPGFPGSADGAGAVARFSYPQGVVADRSGNVYVSDSVNDTIRKIAPNGVVSTLAGTAGSSGTADGTAGAARFNSPTGLTIDGSGDLVVADFGNNLIRKVTPTGVVTTPVGEDNAFGFAPGALPGVISSPTAVAVSGKSLYFTSNNGVALVTDLP